jgi:cysteine desulfurase
MKNASSPAQPVYLDHAATSPLRSEVWAAMEEALSCGFNPASVHAFGRRAHERLEASRAELSALLGCEPREIYFTGGGTQADNVAVLGFSRANVDRRPLVILSTIEHKACLQAAERAEKEGADVRMAPVDESGTVLLDSLEEALADAEQRPTLVSVMWANNEVGAVQPMAEIARLAHDRGALLHTDAVQAFGKIEVSVDRLPADMLTATAHKLGGPVGIGLLYCRDGVRLEPLTFGGSQEKALWPGTQNPLAAVGFARAARLAVEARDSETPRWLDMRLGLERSLKEAIPQLVVHAEDAPERLPHLLSVGVPGCDAAALLLRMDLEGIAVSGGSACSSGSTKGSHVLEAMGVGGIDEYATVRFSFGPGTSAQAVERAGRSMIRAISSMAARA